MKKRRRETWLLLLVSLLTACALLTWPVSAVMGEGTEAVSSESQEENPITEEETVPDQESEESSESGDSAEEAEPTLEELRDELLAIIGEGEETQSIRTQINQMIALGDLNGTLRTYLEGMIRLHQLEYETAQLRESLDQMEAANGSLGTIGEAVTELENPDETLRRVEEEISAQAARLLESAEYDGTGELADLVNQCLAYLDNGTAGADSADVAAILLFAGLRDGEFLNDAGLVTAQDAISGCFSNILSRYTGLSAQTRQSLESASQTIEGRANNASALNPGVLVAAGGALKLTNPVFTYSGTIMISLADAAAFLGGEVVEMEDNDTVVIQAPGVVLEMTKGSSDAYLNDRLQKMAQPVLNFDQVCYLPLDTMLRCCGMERMTIGGYELLYAAP